MKTIIVAGIIALALIASVLIGINALPNLIQPAQGREFSTQTVVNSIRPLGQLTTYEAQFAKAGVGISLRWGVAGACNVGAKHAVQGTVRAAIDLTRISEDDITYDTETKTLTLNLPAPTVAACSVDEIIQYDSYGATVFCSINYDELRQVAQYTSINNFRGEAQSGGLLDRAQSQAKFLLEGFLQTLISNLPNQEGVKIVIRFAPATQVTYDRTCQPNPPIGWRYDAANNAWHRE
jgi:hypothetical protein